MKAETGRLVLFPLTYRQLQKYLACDFSLEKELNLKHITRKISDHFREVIQKIILPRIKRSSGDLHYLSTWIIIDKKNKTIVGTLGFKDKPDEDGNAEIGYGTEEKFMNNGYMTEALSGLISRMVGNSSIKVIIAETDPDNIPSQKVLLKNNFVKLSQSKSTIKWARKL